MKTIFSALIIFLLPLIVFPCGNEYEEYIYTRVDGSAEVLNYPVNPYESSFSGTFNKKTLTDQKRRLEKELKKKKSYQKSSDYALVLLKLGEYTEGLKILQKLIWKHPYEYNIVANLGTAYELNGQNDSAFKYITRAVEINPKSHEGSEWIHLKILEAKIAMEKDPEYLKKHSILDLSVMPGEDYSESQIKRFIKIKKELAWQLKERTSFVPPTDVLVADLLFDLGNLVAVTDYLESSIPVFDKSIEYGPADEHKVRDRRNKLQRTIWLRKINTYAGWGIISTFLITSIAWITIVKRRRKRKEKTLVEGETEGIDFPRTPDS